MCTVRALNGSVAAAVRQCRLLQEDGDLTAGIWREHLLTYYDGIPSSLRHGGVNIIGTIVGQSKCTAEYDKTAEHLGVLFLY